MADNVTISGRCEELCWRGAGLVQEKARFQMLGSSSSLFSPSRCWPVSALGDLGAGGGQLCAGQSPWGASAVKLRSRVSTGPFSQILLLLPVVAFRV